MIWKGNTALLYQRYCGYMQTAVDKAIAASQMFGDNIQTFSQKSKEIDDGANVNATGEMIK